MISIRAIMNPEYFKVIRVYERELKDHMVRKGFDLVGEIGDDNVTKPTQYTLYGDIRKITEREKPYIEHFGKLKDKKEHLYGATQRK